jgi:hypothetical protein
MGQIGRRRELVCFSFVVLLALALAIRGWAALQWEANFDSDEAIFGLMASDIAGGEYVPTVYGTRHLGSIESYIAAFNFKLFGADVLPFRAASLTLMALFFIMHAWYVRRAWGTWAALVSLGFVAVPGFHILSWTHQPIGAYAALLLLGTLVLILARRIGTETQRPAIDFPAMGLIIGLGLWSNQMILAYVAAAAFPAFVNSHEWGRLRQHLAKFVHTRVGLQPSELAPTLVLGLGAVGVAAFFSGACEPVWQFERLAQLGKLALAVVGCGVALGMFWVSLRKQLLLARAALTTAGFAVGYSPLWLAWVTGQQRPISVIRLSCPTGVISRAQLLVEQILPELFGVRPLGDIREMAKLPLLASGVLLLLSIVAIVWFVLYIRRPLWSLISWRAAEDRGASDSLTLGLLLLLPLALSLLGNNTIDVHSIRHLIVTWQAMTIVIGVCVTRINSIPPAVKAVVLVAWAGYFGISNIAFAKTQWPAKFTRFDRAATMQLETYLTSAGTSAGFADYWGAYALDFLTQERIVLAPYNGLNRIPAYTEQVKLADRVAFVFPMDRRPGDGLVIVRLRDYLALENPVSGEGPAHEWIRQGLDAYQVVGRQTVGYWDVWILDRE